MKLFCFGLSLLALMAALDGAAAERRALPTPLPAHPGNVFLSDEDVVVELPKRDGGWSLLDYDGRELAPWTGREGRISPGKLPVGFYRLRSGSTTSATNPRKANCES